MEKWPKIVQEMGKRVWKKPKSWAMGMLDELEDFRYMIEDMPFLDKIEFWQCAQC